MDTQANQKDSLHTHKFPQDEQCWRIFCSITLFGGGSDHVHCEVTQSCNALKITGLKEEVARA